MKIMIGAIAGESGEDALALGSVLCHALGATPLLVNVHPAAFDYPSQAHVDAEWRAYLAAESRAVLAEAAEVMRTRYRWSEVATMVAGHKSSGQGLADVAEAEGADLVVIGSAPGASMGRFQIGSTADKLLHGSPVPVAVAPAGYRRAAPARLGRVVVGFQNTPESRQTVALGAQMAEAADVPLRLLSVLVRHRVYGSKLGSSAESGVIAELAAQTEAGQEDALRSVSISQPTDAVTSIADSPMGALRRLEWEGDELLVLSSAVGGPLRRVFLGDMTYKLLRATPVPALVLPRHGA